MGSTFWILPGVWVACSVLCGLGLQGFRGRFSEGVEDSGFKASYQTGDP